MYIQVLLGGVCWGAGSQHCPKFVVSGDSFIARILPPSCGSMIVMYSHIIHGSAQFGQDDSGDFGTISKDLILVTSPHLPTPFSQKHFSRMTWFFPGQVWLECVGSWDRRVGSYLFDGWWTKEFDHGSYANGCSSRCWASLWGYGVELLG